MDQEPKTYRKSINFVRCSRARDDDLVFEHEEAEVVTNGATFLGLRHWATMTKAERLRHDAWVEEVHDAYVQRQMEAPTIRRLAQRRLSDVVHLDRAIILEALDESITLAREARDRLEEAVSDAYTKFEGDPHDDLDDEIGHVLDEIWNGITVPDPPTRFAMPEKQVELLRERAHRLPTELQRCVIAVVDALAPFTWREREMHEVSFGT